MPPPLPVELKDVLACPRCRGSLEFQEDRSRILCRACTLTFPIREEIPVLLLEEARHLR